MLPLLNYTSYLRLSYRHLLISLEQATYYIVYSFIIKH